MRLSGWVVVLLSLTGSSAFAAFGEFVPQQTGYPVHSSETVDINGDGVRELAIRTGETPPRFGVYSLATSAWLDGPRELPGAPALWAAMDRRADGTIEYVYVSGTDVHTFTPATDTDIITLTATFKPTQLALRGSEESHPFLGLLEYVRTDSIRMDPVWDYTRTDENWTWSVYVLPSGTLLRTINGGRGGSPVVNETRGVAGGMFVYESHAWQSNWMTVDAGEFTQSLHHISREWEPTDSLALPEHGKGMNGVPFFSHWGLKLAATADDPNTNGRILTWGVSSFHTDMMWGLPQYIGGVIYDSLGQRSEWQELIGIDNSAPPVQLPYAGMAIHDFDSDDILDLILPRADANDWEIRDPYTGDVVGIVPNMPSENLRTAPLKDAGVAELYYVAGDQIHIWEPDIVTDVTDESADVLPNDFTLHAHPNPFNSSVTLTWGRSSGDVELSIVNILGQTVRTVSIPPAVTSVEWDGRDGQGKSVPSGVYFARLQTATANALVKLVVLK